jgi:glycosyltransferase involved in cell wall biosynthesis
VIADRRPAVRIYAALRSAHLERLREMTPAQVLFHRTRADFDDSLIDPACAPRRVGRFGAIAELARRPYGVVEVNEPIMVDRWPDLLAQVVAVRLRSLLTRRRSAVVAYCIGRTDPAKDLARRSRLPLWLTRRISRAVMTVLVGGMDRLAFGTTAARDLYASYVPAPRLDSISEDFEALPAACGCLTGRLDRPRSRSLVFLGALDERKGIERVMPAWDAFQGAGGAAHLHVLGSGRLGGAVGEWASGRTDVSFDIDPPRALVHQVLRESAALILLSQRVGPWREQVGLPIVEGLAHGCEVIASSETGLATWLARHGHAVVDPAIPPAELADVMARTLTASRPPAAILSGLPLTDQRLAADAWLMSGTQNVSA